jgi:SAM-dependent methyltransferase
VLDLGCGFGAVAEPLTEMGYEYVGCDEDEGALASLTSRGFETHVLDLGDFDQLPERLAKVADGRAVAVVLLLDVLEHIYPTGPFLSALRSGFGLLDDPVFVVSVPNVAHQDIAAKLVFGRFDYTATGLLDDTHVSFFTDQRLGAETHAVGLLEVASNDFLLPRSDQFFPATAPALAPSSPTSQLLRAWRGLADDHAATNQFIRAYVPRRAHTSADVVPEPARFLTVVMRTQNRRPDNLHEALTCLAAQTNDDFVVLLMVHTEDLGQSEDVAAQVAEFHPTFANRVAVVPVLGGSRGRPLNEGLDRLRSRYVAFLDDDDHVTANWVEEFQRSADDERVVRSTTVERKIAEPRDGVPGPYSIESGLDDRWVVPFDLVQHLVQNHSPICSYAIPASIVSDLGLRFDETLPVIEDWQFFMRAAMLAGVVDTGATTSIYHRWQTGESSTSLHDSNFWLAAHHRVLEEFDRLPLVLPRGSTRKLFDLWNAAQGHGSQGHGSQCSEGAAAESWRARAEALERSRWWRITRPPAHLVDVVRGSLGRVGRRVGS